MALVVGVVGATGAVGEEMVQVLFDRKFPLTELRLFASERSAGKQLKTAFGDKDIEAFSVEAVQQCDFALMAVSGDFSKEFSPKIIADGKTVVIVGRAWGGGGRSLQDIDYGGRHGAIVIQSNCRRLLCSCAVPGRSRRNVATCVPVPSWTALFVLGCMRAARLSVLFPAKHTLSIGVVHEQTPGQV